MKILGLLLVVLSTAFAQKPAVIYGSGGFGTIIPKNGLQFKPSNETLSGAEVTDLKSHLLNTGTGFLLNVPTHARTPIGSCPLTPVYFDGTNWVDANASNTATMATHVITEIVDANNLVLTQAGRVSCPGHGLGVGQFYFLAETTGGLTVTEPLNSNPLVQVETTDIVHILPYRASIMNGTSGTAPGSAAVDSVNGLIGTVVLNTSDIPPTGPRSYVTADEKALITTNEIDIADNAANIATSATNIANNLSAINSNTSNIATNTSDIATNTSNIATNTSDIAANTAVVGSLATVATSGDYNDLINQPTGLNPADFATDTQGALADTALQPGDDISELVNDSGYLTSAPVDSVNTQTGAVVLDADDIDDSSTTNKFVDASQISDINTISTMTSNIATNTSDIATNVGNIATNTSDIATNALDIATNAGNITINTSDISDNTSDIASLLASVATNTSNISTNTSNISTNTSDIATNASDIGDNAVDIVSLGVVTSGHIGNVANPHAVTKTQVGLGNVPDVDATDRANHAGTQTASTISDFPGAVAAFETNITASLIGNNLRITNEDNVNFDLDLAPYLGGGAATNLQSGVFDNSSPRTLTLTKSDSTDVNVDFSTLVLTKSEVGLGLVDNTADSSKPVSIPQQAALDLKVNTADVGTAAAEDIGFFATAAQGALADSALQSGDNISELANDVGYVTAAAFPVTSVNTQTGDVVLDADDLDDSSTTNKFATAAELSQISTNTSDIATNTTNISNNSSNIATNTSDIATNTSGVSSNATNIATNTSDIATNTADIGTNASQIATNTSDIATNASDIATNASNIAGLATVATSGDYGDLLNLPTLGTAAAEDIGFFATAAQGALADSSLQSGDNISELVNDSNYVTAASSPVTSVNTQTGAVVLDADDLDDSSTTNKFATAAQLTQIGNNQTNIATNNGNIATNTSNIATNVSNINVNNTDIAQNTADIGTNQSDITGALSAIAGNDTDISALQTRVTDTESDIADNVTDISALDTRLTTAEGSITSNTSNIASNTTDIASNTTDIATNTTDIAANTTAIANLDTDDVTEAGNLYFTTARARTAAVVGGLAGLQTDRAPSVVSVITAITERVYQVSNTNTTTNLNANTGNYTTDVPIFGTISNINNDGSFSNTTNGVICNFTGFVEVNANVYFQSAGTRPSVQIRLKKNGTPEGPIGSSGYIRQSNGHDEASSHIGSYFMSVTSGDVIRLGSRRSGTTTTLVRMGIAGTSTISVRRLK